MSSPTIPPVGPRAPRRRATPRAILLDAVVAATDAGAPATVVARAWSHASEVARLARDLAPMADVDPRDAAAAGLLHDVGELLLLARHPAAHAELLGRGDGHAARLAAEKAAFGIDHALLGAEHLLERRTPHVIADAVADHHDPYRDSDLTTIVVAAADEIAGGDPDRHHAMDLLGITAGAGAVVLAAVRDAAGAPEPAPAP